MTPLVTILVPTIGARLAYLPDTMRSIADQTFTDFEVKILDNASPEPAHARFVAWAATDRRIEVLRVPERVPQFENFNRGILASRGRYVAFMHDDDVYRPRYLEAQLALLETHPACGIAGSNYDFVDGNGEVTERRHWIKKTEVWSGKRYITNLLSRGRNCIPMPGIVYRKEVFGGRGFDLDVPPYFGDFVLLMRMAETWDLAVVEEAVVGVRRHEGQESLSMPFSRAFEYRTRVLKDYCAEYYARHPEDVRFMRQLERRVDLVHRIAMMWGWLNADSAVEALACAEKYPVTKGRLVDDGVATLLRTLAPRYGESRVRPKNVLGLARRISGTLGV